jgi:NADH:ubiquinone oxidoreductase subunit 4 (subunit M)
MGDARWYEKVTVFLLIFVIAAIGMSPGWLSNMISDSVGLIVERFVVR